MKHEKLCQALDEIRDDYIREAAWERKPFPFRWASAIAAVLALAVTVGAVLPRLAPSSENLGNISSDTRLPQSENPENNTLDSSAIPQGYHLSYLLAGPAYPSITQYSEENYSQWWSENMKLREHPANYADNLQEYFADLIASLFSGSQGQNITCSPVNIYMALAMLAETTGGESRQQLLELLQADSMEALREQAGQVWRAHYKNDGLSTSILGSSLWLHDRVDYNEQTVQTLADSYYASVFRGALGTQEMNDALHAWLNEQTGGLLQEQAQKVELSPNSVLSIATTILYQVQWLDEFREEKNTQAVFHGASGDSTQTFMNRQLSYGPYYWGENFGAVYLSLEDNSRMWLILPDKGVAPESILQEVSGFLAQDPYAYDTAYQDQKSVIVNLSLPKFDIASDMNLVEKLKELGVTDIFDSTAADFSPILTEADGGWVDRVTHAARVAVDEKGVTAAAFTVIDRCGSSLPPEEEIDFTLDRPFLFYIESQDGLPLFTGIVNEP